MEHSSNAVNRLFEVSLYFIIENILHTKKSSSCFDINVGHEIVWGTNTRFFRKK
jgi:hypothetical protein